LPSIVKDDKKKLAKNSKPITNAKEKNMALSNSRDNRGIKHVHKISCGYKLECGHECLGCDMNNLIKESNSAS